MGYLCPLAVPICAKYTSIQKFGSPRSEYSGWFRFKFFSLLIKGTYGFIRGIICLTVLYYVRKYLPPLHFNDRSDFKVQNIEERVSSRYLNGVWSMSGRTVNKRDRRDWNTSSGSELRWGLIHHYFSIIFVYVNDIYVGFYLFYLPLVFTEVAQKNNTYKTGRQARWRYAEARAQVVGIAQERTGPFSSALLPRGKVSDSEDFATALLWLCLRLLIQNLLPLINICELVSYT